MKISPLSVTLVALVCLNTLSSVPCGLPVSFVHVYAKAVAAIATAHCKQYHQKNCVDTTEERQGESSARHYVRVRPFFLRVEAEPGKVEGHLFPKIVTDVIEGLAKEVQKPRCGVTVIHHLRGTQQERKGHQENICNQHM